MTVSRKSPGEEDYEFTKEDYMEDKAMCEERSGYAPKTEQELAEQAVNEKLPGGSQDY